MRKSKKTNAFELSNAQKLVYAKYFSALVIMVIIMFYAVSFAMDSRNYTVNKQNDDILNSNKIYSGVYVGEVYIGGLTKSQAKELAQRSYADSRLESYTINFKTDYGYDKTVNYRELGGNYDIDKAVDEAYDKGRSGSKAERIATLDDMKGKGEHVSATYSVDEGVLKETIRKIVDDVNKEYNLKGSEADYDRTYEMAFKNIQIQEKDIEIYVPEVQNDGE